MTDFNQFHDSFSNIPPPPKKMPDMINVLTILTFIWCAYELFSGCLGYAMACKQTLAGDSEQLSKTPFASLFSSLQETLVRACEMKVPLLIIHLLGPIICFVGALQMRKLKKSGFVLYLIGEIGAPLASIFLMGGGALMIAGSFFFPILFVILYATQLKHLQ